MSRERILIPTVLAVVGAMLLGACGSPLPQAAATPQPHTIAVMGEGQAFGEPDIAYVSLGVNVTNVDVGLAVSQANGAMDRITAALGSLGIDAKDIQTTYYNVWPEQPINPQTGEAAGPTKYHVDSTLQVKVRQIDQAGDVIQKALDSGANTVNGLSFSIDDPKPLQTEARKAAVDDARRARHRTGLCPGCLSRRSDDGERVLQCRPAAAGLRRRGGQGAGGRGCAHQHRPAQRGHPGSGDLRPQSMSGRSVREMTRGCPIWSSPFFFPFRLLSLDWPREWLGCLVT